MNRLPLVYNEPTEEEYENAGITTREFRRRYAIYLTLIRRKIEGEDVEKDIEEGKAVLRKHADNLINAYDNYMVAKKNLETK